MKNLKQLVLLNKTHMIKSKLNKLHTVQKLYNTTTYKYTSQTLCRITAIHEK